MLLPNMISWTRDRKLLPDEWRSKLLLYCMCAAMVRVSQATTSINPVFESGKPRAKHLNILEAAFDECTGAPYQALEHHRSSIDARSGWHCLTVRVWACGAEISEGTHPNREKKLPNHNEHLKSFFRKFSSEMTDLHVLPAPSLKRRSPLTRLLPQLSFISLSPHSSNIVSIYCR